MIARRRYRTKRGMRRKITKKKRRKRIAKRKGIKVTLNQLIYPVL